MMTIPEPPEPPGIVPPVPLIGYWVDPPPPPPPVFMFAE